MQGQFEEKGHAVIYLLGQKLLHFIFLKYKVWSVRPLDWPPLLLFLENKNL